MFESITFVILPHRFVVGVIERVAVRHCPLYSRDIYYITELIPRYPHSQYNLFHGSLF